MRQTRPPTLPTGIRRTLFRLPRWLYHARLGVLLGHRLVLIHHIGRKSGRRREVVVEVVQRDAATGTVTVASGFGVRADWYQNLLARPDVVIQLGRRTFGVHASRLEEDAAGDAMVSYARRHAHAAKALAGFMGFAVDGSEDDYREVGRHIPMLRLSTRTPDESP